MKKLTITLVAFVMTVAGVCTPGFAAPTVEQVQQLVENQPPTQDARVLNAQQAFALASISYTTNKMINQLNDTEKQIDKILEAEDLSASLEQSVAEAIPADTLATISTLEEMQELVEKDPALQEKILQAYLKNKYIKQLIPLFWANQDEYELKDIDQKTFDQLVIACTSMVVAMQQQMQQLQEIFGQEEE